MQRPRTDRPDPGLGGTGRPSLSELVDALDRDGSDVDPSLLMRPLRKAELQPRHRELLEEFVDRFWPETIVVDIEERDRRASKALWVGAQLDLKLNDARWTQLLDGLLATPEWRRFDLAGDRADWWLARQYRRGLEVVLVERMPDQDARGVATLMALASRRAGEAVIAAAADRLTELVEEPGWPEAAGMLAERGLSDARMRRLMDLPLSDDHRLQFDGWLAQQDDGQAQLRLIKRWTNHPSSVTGQEHQRPAWRPDSEQRGMLEALSALIDSTAPAGETEILGWAATGVGQQLSPEALVELERLAQSHPTQRWVLLSTADELRGRLATGAVLARLPAELGEVAEALLGPAG